MQASARHLLKWLLHAGLPVLLCLLPQWAAAQTIDSLEWVEGTSVARISFNANVRFLRQAPSPGTGTDLAQLSFQIVAADEQVVNQSVDEGKRLAAVPGLPRIDLKKKTINKV